MTHPARHLRLVLCVLTLLFVLAPLARSEDPPPPDWVAKVQTKDGWRYLGRGNLASAVLWRVGQELQEAGSGPTTILRQLVQERMIEQEARRLGLVVSEQEVDREYRRLDAEVRRVSNGAKTLEQVIKREQNSSVREFRVQLRHQLLKERVSSHQQWLGPLPKDEKSKIAQVEVVIAELLKKTDVKYGIKTALQAEPTPMAKGTIATVNGEPISALDFGEAMVIRLPTGRIRKILQAECKAVLTAGWALSVPEMGTVLATEKERWNAWRKMANQVAMQEVSYEDYVKMKYRLDLEGLQQDRYFRGLYGLVRSFKADIKPEKVREAYEKEKNGIYGDGYLVTDIEILFAPRDALLGPSAGAGRDRKEAHRLANQILRRIHAQEDFKGIIRELNEKRDPTVKARRLRVRNTANGRFLYEQARILKDGQTSRPFETLAEIHVIRREEALPAPSYAEVQEMILEGMASKKANEWLDDQLSDKTQVEIRWPLPDLTAPTPGR